MKLKRITSMARYLSWAAPIYRWRVTSGDCPLCGHTYFISLNANAFMTRCLKCKCNITNLSLIPIVIEHCQGNYKKSAYELSSYGCTLDFLNRNFEKIQSSEYYPSKELGTLVEGIANQDIQKLTYGDNSFDIVTSNQVFEHVPDDIKGFSECFRVLRTGGALIFTVPWYDTKETTRKATLLNGRIVFDGEPEYHDSRIDGANSSPVFHHHSKNDICERVKSVGFSKAFLREVKISKYQGSSQLVLYAIK